jgi:hypothetical protein
MAQTWNNVLGFIKRRLGAKINLLEMSDDEIIEGITDDVLPYFSQYIPYQKYVLITQGNLAPGKTGYNRYRYNIPIDTVTEQIIDVEDVYFGADSTILDDYGYEISNPSDIVSVAMANKLADISESMSVRQTWEFIPPNMLETDQDILTGCIVKYSVSHTKLDTIPPDYFQTVFKPLCLANVKQWISALRSKYEGLNTPFGEIRVNWQKLEQEYQQEFQELEQKLLRAPGDHYIHIC